MWFPSRSDTNQAVQSQNQASSLKFRIKKQRKCSIRVAKTMALISFAVTAKLICVFVFAYADCWFSHEAAHILTEKQNWTFIAKCPMNKSRFNWLNNKYTSLYNLPWLKNTHVVVLMWLIS